MTAIGAVVAVWLAAAPSPEGFKEQMGEAIGRHDAGDYPGAMKIYRSLLVERPHDPNVVYELSLSMMMGKAPPNEMISFIEGELKHNGKHLPQLYATLAAAYDTNTQFTRGEAILRQGLQVAPDNVDLLFNLGVNLMMQDKPVEAEPPLKKAVQLKPQWSAVWRTLSLTLEANHKQLDAFLVKARFVAMEANTSRGKTAAQDLMPLLMHGVEKTLHRIDVNVGKGAKDIGINLVAATRWSGHEKESDGEFFVYALGQVVNLAFESKPDPFRKFVLAMFEAAKKDGVLVPLGWMLMRSAGDANADRWFATHRKEEAKLKAFFN